MLSVEISEKKREIHSDAYPMSIGELVNLYTDGELDIHPEFQRIYRWSDVQKSKLIESILLGIPLPSIFISQRDDGIWDVVDGLQRLSTIFSFMGIYRDEEGNIRDRLVLKGTDYLPSLEGVSWGDGFDVDLQRSFKREKIDLKIIKKESDVNTKYDLFQRLNTLGSALSDQEVRNCLLIMLNKDFHARLKSLSEYDNFVQCIPFTDKQLDESYPMELVLRFLVLTNIDLGKLSNIDDVGNFITDEMKSWAQKNAQEVDFWSDIFRATFDLLSQSCGEDSFRKYHRGSYKGGFLLSIYEVVAMGVGHALCAGVGVTPDKIRNETENLFFNQVYVQYSGSGVRASSRLPNIIPLGREIFTRV